MKNKTILGSVKVGLIFLFAVGSMFSVAFAVAPVVTDANVSISGATGNSGVYKIGDTITATWNNTASGDNNVGVTAVTFDFSQFGGGAAVVASNSSETYTATYTIVSGSSGGINKNVSVTATIDLPTTISDTANATLDDSAPIISSITSNATTSGALKIGNTILFNLT